jgi:hypothetical protein
VKTLCERAADLGASTSSCAKVDPPEIRPGQRGDGGAQVAMPSPVSDEVRRSREGGGVLGQRGAHLREDRPARPAFTLSALVSTA